MISPIVDLNTVLTKARAGRPQSGGALAKELSGLLGLGAAGSPHGPARLRVQAFHESNAGSRSSSAARSINS